MKVVRLMGRDFVFNKSEWLDYQRRLFDWHCERFFDYGSALTSTELEYIDCCIRHSADTRLLSGQFSLFSYSHKVDTLRGKANSSRLAYGTLCGALEPAGVAARVVSEKEVPLEQELFFDPNLRFYGLGWDVENSVDKAYFFVEDISALHGKYAALINENGSALSKKGILSFSFQGKTRAEEKVYVFHRHGEMRDAAVLCSERRRVVQFNNTSASHRKRLERFSSTSGEIIRAYQERFGTVVDTYAVDEERGLETLYFDYRA